MGILDHQGQTVNLCGVASKALICMSEPWKREEDGEARAVVRRVLQEPPAPLVGRPIRTRLAEAVPGLPAVTAIRQPLACGVSSGAAYMAGSATPAAEKPWRRSKQLSHRPQARPSGEGS